MSEGSLEIVRGIYCRTLLLDPDLLAVLGTERAVACPRECEC